MTPSAEDVLQNTANIAVLGVGAVGQLICHQLTAKAAKVLLLTRDVSGPQTLTCQPLMDASATSCVPDSVTHQYPSLITTNLTAEHLAHIRLLIVTTKAYQVVALLTPLLAKLRADCHILLLHNGMGPHLALSVLLAQHPAMGLSLGTTSQGAMRLSQWQIKHTGTGLTQLGHGFGAVINDNYRALLLDAIPDSHWQDDIITSLWQKLAINCAINPLTAIHQCQNGALAAPQHQDTISQLLLELIPVAKAQGVKLELDNLLEKVNQVIHLTAQNYSSMYQDITHHRPTEIAQINGYVSQCAQEYGLKTPLHHAILASIKSLEAQD
ncbi:2-dehydropantoate 2-reductase [Shewanella denitrificans OS217]|jgi:2-dehydropantoate 2-reductase|uniref:2-dehydropantoate 2-reductase n=1 Tax=Shewanella denitrificans (strain OS217 / ATCC BAA-1090 / DSM 15013) TaxID=318161 RepID=Q12R68_SHEDO|nr:2-dehydropantoate 2-reductase [Shewanella denitrificans]ABE54058.1 2-dehydropantoate 2-reductase [Shewanella denitrificans OS217]